MRVDLGLVLVDRVELGGLARVVLAGVDLHAVDPRAAWFPRWRYPCAGPFVVDCGIDPSARSRAIGRRRAGPRRGPGRTPAAPRHAERQRRHAGDVSRRLPLAERLVRASRAARRRRPSRALVQGHLEDLRQVQRPAVGQAGDLLAATEAVGDDQRVVVGLRARRAAARARRRRPRRRSGSASKPNEPAMPQQPESSSS